MNRTSPSCNRNKPNCSPSPSTNPSTPSSSLPLWPDPFKCPTSRTLPLKPLTSSSLSYPDPMVNCSISSNRRSFRSINSITLAISCLLRSRPIKTRHLCLSRIRAMRKWASWWHRSTGMPKLIRVTVICTILNWWNWPVKLIRRIQRPGFKLWPRPISTLT